MYVELQVLSIQQDSVGIINEIMCAINDAISITTANCLPKVACTGSHISQLQSWNHMMSLSGFCRSTLPVATIKPSFKR